MNFSLKKRIVASFVFVMSFVLILGLTVFIFLDALHEEINNIAVNLDNENSITDEVRISTINISRIQQKINSRRSNLEDIKDLVAICSGLESQIQALDSVFSQVEIKKALSEMLGYVRSLKNLSEQTNTVKNTFAIATLNELGENIMDQYAKFSEMQFDLSREREKKMRTSIDEVKKYMLITLILSFLAAILLSIIIPGKIALPFKKINDAIRELQECNFDVNIYYKQTDEIGELAHEINKMVANIKKFEELRTDRISVELRKFHALANLLNKFVMVVNASGELIYLNNSLYSTLHIKSDDVIGKKIEESLIPNSIKETYQVALKRRTKIENIEVFYDKPIPTNGDSETVLEVLDENGIDEVTDIGKTDQQLLGFATVIPIRGKDSSLDYYLMVIGAKEIA